MEKNYYIFISVLVFGIIGAFSYPGGNSGVEGGEDDLNFYRDIDGDTREWLKNLSAKWRVQGNSWDVQCYIYDYLERNKGTAYVTALKILVNTHDFYNTKSDASLAMTVIDNFRGWLSIHPDLSSKDRKEGTKRAAASFVNEQNYEPLKEKVAETYEIEADTTLFSPSTESSRREAKYGRGAQSSAMSVDVSASFAEHKTLLLSLIVQGKMNEVREYIHKYPAVGKMFAIYMDCLIDDANVSQIFHQFIESNGSADENDWPMELQAIKNNIWTLVRRWRLLQPECPNIYQYHREKLLWFFIQMYRGERHFRGEIWASAVTNLVGSNRKLKLLLVKELNRRGEFKEGVYWAQYYSIPMNKWISDIRQLGTIESFPDNSGSSSYRHQLPKITLPSFFGGYSAWPLFRDLFKSTVIDNARITRVEKMEYLRSSVSGAAAELIENLPVSADSFDSAWALLASRFENRRLLVSAQLDKLTDIRVALPGSSESLNALVTTMTDALTALDALGSPVSQWDQLLVHIVAQRLDLPTREAWKVELGSSNEYPSLDRLKSFLTERVRALEQHESSLVHSSSTGEPEAPYPCDLCVGNHYVVRCPTFRAMTGPLRLNSVHFLQLCFNCLGRHLVSACRMKQTCKTCGHKHHTMLHLEPARGRQRYRNPSPSDFGI